MATLDEAVASTLSPRQLAQLNTLLENVEKAEAAKDQPTPVADAVKAADKFLAGFPVDTLFTGKARTEAQQTIAALGELVVALKPKVEVADWSEGNEAASKVNHNLLGDGYEPEAVPVIVDVLERWTVATKAKGGKRGTGNTDWPDLPTRIYAHCELCGWSQYTGKANPNSLRHYSIKHLREEHQIELSPRYNGDKQQFGQLTAAVTEVMDNVASAPKVGGGFRIDTKAA